MTRQFASVAFYWEAGVRVRFVQAATKANAAARRLVKPEECNP
jgi:hypothetical protein